MQFNWLKLVKVIGTIVFVAAGVLAYGNDILFERIYLALLVFLAIIFIKEINILSVIVITTAANLCFMFLYPILGQTDHLQMPLSLLTYTAIIFTLYKLKTEDKRQPIALVVILCIAAELYWLATGYQAPNIYWYVFIININVLTRHFLFQRCFIMSKYFPRHYRSLDLDYSLHKICWYYNIIHIAVILEYFVRHILGFSQMTVIYEASIYLLHALTTYSVLLILVQSYAIIRKEWQKI